MRNTLYNVGPAGNLIFFKLSGLFSAHIHCFIDLYKCFNINIFWYEMFTITREVHHVTLKCCFSGITETYDEHK